MNETRMKSRGGKLGMGTGDYPKTSGGLGSALLQWGSVGDCSARLY